MSVDFRFSIRFDLNLWCEEFNGRYNNDNTDARAGPLFVQRERVDSCRRVRVRMIVKYITAVFFPRATTVWPSATVGRCRRVVAALRACIVCVAIMRLPARSRFRTGRVRNAENLGGGERVLTTEKKRKFALSKSVGKIVEIEIRPQSKSETKFFFPKKKKKLGKIALDRFCSTRIHYAYFWYIGTILSFDSDWRDFKFSVEIFFAISVQSERKFCIFRPTVSCVTVRVGK